MVAGEKPLEGRVALVTGASKGIGRAIAVKLAERGARVIVNYRRDRRGAEETAEKIKEIGGEAHIVRADVSDPQQVQAMVEEAHRVYGRVTILVSNAGVGYAVPFEKLTLDLWERQLRVNLTGAFIVTKAFLQDMIEEGWGRILIVSSIAGITGAELLSAYSAAKAGLIGFAKTLAIELAKYSVRVNVLAPGFVETRLGESYFRLLSEETGRNLLEEYKRDRTLTGELASVEEIAEIAAVLADPRIENVTGQVFVIDSGTTISSGMLPRR